MQLASANVMMKSHAIALLVPPDSLKATLLVRRADGQFSLERIDSRVASASCAAAAWFRKGAPIVDPSTSKVVGYEIAEIDPS
jgi:hypothetical protein